ncbi:MAG: hypothetical protein KGI54_10605 [Pseudomonadota bacterium]|nr:hypothetical protein [Pseudomonadota bacterium]
MKFPKHRANVFVVQRSPVSFNDGMYGGGVVVGVFPTSEGADEFKGACEQEFVDKGLKGCFLFDVTMSTFYDA